MSLPAQRSLTKSERDLLSSKLQAFNTFLKKATSESFLSNPQVFEAVFAFLSKEEYTHVTKDSIKVVCACVVMCVSILSSTVIINYNVLAFKAQE